MRIQVVAIQKEENRSELFAFHGELLLICLRGEVSVRTDDGSHALEAHDQLLLVDGEPFAVEPSGAEDALVQFVWTPGPNPCKTCQDRGVGAVT